MQMGVPQMLLRKALSILSVLLLAAMVLAACGGKEGGGPSASGNEGASGPSGSSGASGGESVTLKMMHLWPAGVSAGQNKIVDTIIQEYKSQNPNVTIQLDVLDNEQYKSKLQILSTSNELPDVGLTWAAGFLEPYAKGGMFAPLDDLLTGDLKDMFVPGTTEAYAIDGKTYALPLELNIAPIYYNKEIFEKYNLSVPETFDDLKNVVSTLAGSGVTPITLGNKDRWTGSLWYVYLVDRVGGPEPLRKALDRSGSFEDPTFVEAARLIQELVDLNAFTKGFNGLTNDEIKVEFINEQSAMYLMGTWELPNYTTNPDVPEEFKKDVGFFKFPTVSGGKGDKNSWVGGPGVGLFVAENSKHKEEAKKFVEFFVRKWGEVAVFEAGVLPATKVDTSKGELPQLYIDLLNELGNASSITLYYDVQMKPGSAETHLNLIQALFGKAVTPEEFAKQQEAKLAEEYGG